MGLWRVSIHASGGASCHSNLLRGGGSSDTGNVDWWEEFPPDASIFVARVAAVFATVLGGLSWLATMVLIIAGWQKEVHQQGQEPQQPLWHKTVLVSMLTITAMAQIVTLSFLGTTYCNGGPCYLEHGAIGAATSTFFWVLSAAGVGLLL